MLGYLFLLFTVLPILELIVIIKVGAKIGALNTVLILLATGAIGAFLARLQGFLVLRKVQDNLNNGIMPSSELLDGFMIFAGGVLLLTPGFITDIFGILLLIPITRSIIKFLLKRKLQAVLKNGQVVHVSSFDRPNSHYDDIDIN